MAEVKPEDFQPTAQQLQQHPELALLLLLAGGVMLLVLLGSLAAWTTAFMRWSAKQTILQVEPWTPRVWGLVDLLLVAVLVVVGQTVGIKLWANASGANLKELRDEADFPLSAMAAGSLSYLVVMLIMLAWMMIRYRASPSHLGFNIRRLFSMLGVGIAAAVMWIPVVWIIMVAVSLGFSEKYDHPLLERLSDTPSLSAYLLATFCAVAVAPIAEEFLFRVLLQGWLQSLPWSGRGMWWFFGASQATRDAAMRASQLADLPRIIESADDNQVDNHAYEAARQSMPYLPPAPAAPTEAVVTTGNQPPILAVAVHDPGGGTISGAPAPPLWPVFVSGTLFGLAHWGYGLSFIPLILLGIILGLLYRAKHSIWPSFAVHFTLNFISMLMLGVSLVMQSIVK